ncbi:MAG: hypothetical protein ACLSX8_06975 [Veillonella parvula]|uniref:hypothetical protein n=1 Tax=Veillonella parvula TaxID=29466 RepID=UPI0039919A86
MAEWSNATMTDVGADLQAKVNAGKTKLTFTKIKVGSGVNATNPLALTDVISSKWETTNFIVKLEGKIVSVDTVITNTGIHEAFRMSEIGLFAQDPDKGEILYAYLTDPEPDRMPAESGSVVVSQELTIGMVFSNTGNVSLTVNIGALITREQLTEAVKQHNTDISSHPPITDQIKAILGSANWKDSPASTLVTIKSLLGQGAIVASKLDANAGFVKFANGFTIQWGLTWFLNQNTYCDVTLPIRCNVLVALCTDDSASTNTRGDEFYVSWNSGFSNNNRASIRFLTNRGNAGNFTWLCVGIS